uniref:Uncharacterized protein n=1 Tax=Siphoviridae sp. ctXfh4 TaxID=2827887 RepID=A0A8S5SFZ8_9CAUD|nr:MAG TPA: hypothetical protein [Siphoviridae sp. ctXfh4]DAM93117.1 MAG TPA: hypothetical protein [Caudoviricetes sp.]DAT22617.1 MAG TPA: hypothetical protein [Caudoviricetes sp.]
MMKNRSKEVSSVVESIYRVGAEMYRLLLT